MTHASSLPCVPYYTQPSRALQLVSHPCPCTSHLSFTPPPISLQTYVFALIFTFTPFTYPASQIIMQQLHVYFCSHTCGERHFLGSTLCTTFTPSTICTALKHFDSQNIYYSQLNNRPLSGTIFVTLALQKPNSTLQNSHHCKDSTLVIVGPNCGFINLCKVEVGSMASKSYS